MVLVQFVQSQLDGSAQRVLLFFVAAGKYVNFDSHVCQALLHFFATRTVRVTKFAPQPDVRRQKL